MSIDLEALTERMRRVPVRDLKPVCDVWLERVDAARRDGDDAAARACLELWHRCLDLVEARTDEEGTEHE